MKIISLFLKIVIVFSIIFSIIYFTFIQKEFSYDKKNISVGNNQFAVEVADDLEKRSLGLGRRQSLCDDCGMFFIFPEQNLHTFWMKDMNFDLDILWLRNGKVVYIERNVSHLDQEKRYGSEELSDSVLEINAGLVDRLGIKVGDEIILGD